MPQSSRGKKRKPAKKYIKRNVSGKRFQRLSRSMMGTARSYVDMIWDGCQRFVNEFNSDDFLRTHEVGHPGRAIFIGRTMRSIFETVRAINEIDGKHSRKAIRYFVTPPSKIMPGYFRTPVNIPRLNRLISVVADGLKKSHIVSTTCNEYFLVDFQDTGNTLHLLKLAVEHINPNAKVHNITRWQGKYDDILKLEPPVATWKSITGRRQRAHNNVVERARYLAFQKALQERLKKKEESDSSGKQK